MFRNRFRAICIGIAGVFLLVYGFREFNQTRKLQSEGRKTTGEVTGFEEKSARRGRIKYYLTVAFNTEAGQKVVETRQVTSTIFSDAVHVKQVPVIYLPSEPHLCRFSPEVSKDFTGLGIGTLMLGASVVTSFRRID